MRTSAVLIARNERKNVLPCLASFADHVDEIAFVDTGSRDGTVGELRRVMRLYDWGRKVRVGSFKWCDDFAAARQAAQDLATGDVHIRIDLDDRVVGAEHLPSVAQRFEDPELSAVMAIWRGPITPPQWRAQIFRTPLGWAGRTYEFPVLLNGRAQSTAKVRWEHMRTRPRGRRDLDIALAWHKDEPFNWRPLNAAAEEARIMGLYPLVDDCCQKALAMDLPEGIRAYFLQIQARTAYDQKDYTLAARLAKAAIKLAEKRAPDDTDFLELAHQAWLCLMRCELQRHDQRVLRCAREAIEAASTDYRRQEVIRVLTEHLTGKGLAAELAQAAVDGDKVPAAPGNPSTSAKVNWVVKR